MHDVSLSFAKPIYCLTFLLPKARIFLVWVTMTVEQKIEISQASTTINPHFFLPHWKDLQSEQICLSWPFFHFQSESGSWRTSRAGKSWWLIQDRSKARSPSSSRFWVVKLDIICSRGFMTIYRTTPLKLRHWNWQLKWVVTLMFLFNKSLLTSCITYFWSSRTSPIGSQK